MSSFFSQDPVLIHGAGRLWEHMKVRLQQKIQRSVPSHGTYVEKVLIADMLIIAAIWKNLSELVRSLMTVGVPFLLGSGSVWGCFPMSLENLHGQPFPVGPWVNYTAIIYF